MEKSWALLKASDVGPMGRGQNGKKKIYEVRVSGNVLTCSWGMAEKLSRQTSRQAFASHQAAVSAAYAKVYSKVDRGYKIAYAV
jgi:predicted DNA-binding WGR domain protein